MTVNVINAVSNVLRVDKKDYVISTKVEAPTRILDSLEGQITVFQTSGLGSNVTITKPNIAVAALKVHENAVQSGLGFASRFAPPGNKDENSAAAVIYTEKDQIFQEQGDASIYLPGGVFDVVDDSITGVNYFQCSSCDLMRIFSLHLSVMKKKKNDNER